METLKERNNGISIIIPNFNGNDIITNCLESIYKQKNINYEIIVVDDKSSDDSLGILEHEKDLGKIKLFKNEENCGYAGSCDVGAKKANYPILIFMNSDAFFISDDHLHGLDGYFANNESIGIFGFYQQYQDGSPQFIGSNVDIFLTLDPAAKNAGKIKNVTEIRKKIYEVFMTGGACFAIRKDVYNSIGGFDSDYFLYVEELDLMWRTQIAGFKVATILDFPVIHLGGKSTNNRPNKISNNTNFQKIYLRERNSIVTMIKNYQALTLIFILPLHFFLNVLEALFSVVIGKAFAAKAYFNAWKYLVANSRKILDKRSKVSLIRKTGDWYFFRRRMIVFSYFKLKHIMKNGLPKIN